MIEQVFEEETTVQDIKVKRTRKTPEQLEILEKLYSDGMTDCKTSFAKDLIDEAVRRTQLDAEKVKEWVRSKNKAKRPSKVVEKLNKRQPSGYDVFRKKYMIGAFNETAQINQKWGELPEEEKLKYKKEAESMVLPSFKKMTDGQKEIFIQQKRKAISDLCEELSMAGSETCVLEYRASQGSLAYGSDTGRSFAFNYQLPIKFTCFNEGQEAVHINTIEKIKKTLNKKFFDATKGRYTRVAYGKITSGEFVVHGLPLGVNLKSPVDMTKKDLEVLEKHLDHVHFTVNSAKVNNSNPVSISAPDLNTVSPTEASSSNSNLLLQESDTEFHDVRVALSPLPATFLKRIKSENNITDESLESEDEIKTKTKIKKNR